MVKRAISNITNVMVRKQTEIVSVASMLIVIGLATKVLGLIFNALAAGYLGTTAYNSFIFASALPELASQVILFGAISASVLPVLTGVLDKHGSQRFSKVFSSLINISLVLFTLAAVLIGLFAHDLLPWFIETVIQPKEEIKNIAELGDMLRVLMIPQVILGISVYLSTALNIYERFLVPQLAPLFYNLGRILAIFILIPFMGNSPWVLVIGTIIGSLIHLAVQVPVVLHLGVRYQLVADFKDKYIRKIGMVAAPRIAAISGDQIRITIDKFIAFGLVNNSLALYNLAILIISVPLSVFGVSFATASFPSLAKAFNNNDRILASQIFYKVVNQIIFFSVPAAVLLLVLRVPISRMAFGVFGEEIGFLETYTIAWVILFFAPGIVFESLRTVIYRAFYAAHDTIRPLVISIGVLIFGTILGVLFTNYLSNFDTFALQSLTFDLSYFFSKESGGAAVGGLALRSSVIFTVESLVLIYWLNRTYLHARWGEVMGPILRKITAGGVMLLFCYVVYKIWAGLDDTEKTAYLIILTATTTAASLMIYLGVSWALRVPEVKGFIEFLIKYPNLKAFRRFRNFDPIPEDPEIMK